MSLKAFHIVFIAASALLAFGVGGWALYAYITGGAFTDLLLGAAACIAGVGLIVYGIKFLEKLKHVRYL